MAALGWLMNLGFGGGAAPEAETTYTVTSSSRSQGGARARISGAAVRQRVGSKKDRNKV